MKNYLKLSLFSLAIVLIISGCGQKIKPVIENNVQLPEKIVLSTIETTTASSELNSDIVISKVGNEEIITHNKYQFSLVASSDSVVVNNYLASESALETFMVGDLEVIIATSALENLNKGFFEEEAPVANSDILKQVKIAVASGQIGQAYFYDYVTPDYSVHNYSFLISINKGKNILILKMGYNGESDRKDFFKGMISKVSVN